MALALLLLSVAACQPTVAPKPPPAAPQALARTPLEALADAWRPTKVPIELEGQMPIEVRMLVPGKEEQQSSRELLKLAQQHFAATQSSKEADPDVWLREMLAAILLAERAAKADNDDGRRASLALAGMLQKATKWIDLSNALLVSLDSLERGGSKELGSLLRAHAALSPQFPLHLQHHLVRVLEAGRPAQTAREALWMALQISVDTADMQAALTEYRRMKGGALSADEATRFVELRAQHGDLATFTTELDGARRALSTLPVTEQRPRLARLTDAEDKRAAFERLTALQGEQVDVRLERYDRLEQLEQLERHEAAELEIRALEHVAPHDGRVRARLALSAFRREMPEHGLFQAAALAHRTLLAVAITRSSLEDAQMRVGLAGVQSAATLSKLADNPPPRAVLDALAPLQEAAIEFHQRAPDAAAGLYHALSLAPKLTDLMSNDSPNARAKLARANVDGLLELRRRLPHNADLARLALLYAAALDDPKRGLSIALDARGSEAPKSVEDIELVLTRAGAILRLAILSDDLSPLDALRASLEALPAVQDEKTEQRRLVALADLSMVRALRSGDPSWREVASLYARAEASASSFSARLHNNHAYALLRTDSNRKKDTPEMFNRASDFSAEGESKELRTVALLNLAIVADQESLLQHHAEEELRRPDSNTDASTVLLRWLVARAPTVAQARAHAQTALALESKNGGLSKSLVPNESLPLVCDATNTVSLGANTRTLGYQFRLTAACELWLTDAKLASARSIETLAGPARKR